MLTAAVPQGFLFYLLPQLPPERHGSQKFFFGVAEGGWSIFYIYFLLEQASRPCLLRTMKLSPYLITSSGGIPETSMDTACFKVLASDSLGIG